MGEKKNFSPDGGTLDDTIIQALKEDEGFREEYLKGLLSEKDIPMLALCLKPVVEVLGGVGKLARETGLGRQSLYKALSGKQRPDFTTLLKILNFAGYELSLKKKGSGASSAVEARENHAKWKLTKSSAKEGVAIRRGVAEMKSGKAKTISSKNLIKPLKKL